MTPKASIIIRSFNEEKHLSDLFDALDSQDFKDFETLVIDSGSYDQTCEIALARATRLIQIPQRDFTFGHSLNVGIREACGEFCAIISAHAIPKNPNWLSKLLEPFQDKKVAMSCGSQRGCSTSKYGELRDFERVFGEKRLELSSPEFLINNANSAIRKSLWEKEPFDETLPGLEDIAWARSWFKRGYKAVYEPQAAVTHIHEESWDQVHRRYYREGQAARWIGVRRRRELLDFSIEEAKALAGDFTHAVKDGVLLDRTFEIIRFRWNRLTGTIQGVHDGALMENPLTAKRFLFDRAYKSVVINGPNDASLEDRTPPDPTPSEVLVRVAYEGVCATDLEILEGTLGYYANGMAQYPIIPGHEFSGTVAEIGPRVSKIKVGDHVVVECIQGCGECEHCKRNNPIACDKRQEVGVIRRDGGYAEFMVTPERFVHVIPNETSLQTACLTEPLAVVLKGLRRIKLDSESSAAVIGAGPIGHLTARVLRHRGNTVTVFDKNKKRLELLKSSGAKTALEPTDLDQFDAIIEATGNPDVLESALSQSRPGALLLLLGFPYDRREFSFESIVGYDRTIIGSVGSTAEDFKTALGLLEKLDLKAFTSRILPLSEFQTAWKLARAGDPLKVLLKVDQTKTSN